MTSFYFLLLADVSQGLSHEVGLVEDLLNHYASSRQYELLIEKKTIEEIRINPKFISSEFSRITTGQIKKAVVFWEKLVDCKLLYDDSFIKIFIPNSEIIVPTTLELLPLVDHFWHKTQLSTRAFKGLAPQSAHFFTGFSSSDPEATVKSYARFAHFRGKASNRHSTELLNVWRENPHYPELRYHFYQELSASWEEPFEFKEWLTCRNISVMAGKIDQDFYYQQLSECGIHLCLSGVEGFGHYINEARAMGALVVVIDAPPMNEFIDANSGILITPRDQTPAGLVYRHRISEVDIKLAIDKITALSEDARRKLGQAARARYLSERQLFHERMALILDLISK